MTDLVRLEVAARDLGVSARTIERYALQGRLTLYRVGPKPLRMVDMDEVYGLLVPIQPRGKDQDQ